MSGVFKGIKKIFKKVVNVVKPLLPVIAIGAAIYFTAGAAMAAAPAVAGTGAVGAAAGATAGAAGAGAGVAAAGGAGAATAAATTGTLGSVLSGAATHAAWGAGIGAVGSAVTGGDPIRGALMGAAMGTVTGGISGYMNAPVAAAGTGITQTELAAPQGLSGSMGGDVLSGGAGVSTAAPAAAPAVAQAATAPAASPTAAGLLGPGGWVERNPLLAGMAVQGLGQGIMAASTPSAADETIKVERERAKRIAGNYGNGLIPGYTPAARMPEGTPTPAQRFDPSRYDGSYEWSPEESRIVFVPRQRGA